jgi:hypothetical protein
LFHVSHSPGKTVFHGDPVGRKLLRLGRLGRCRLAAGQRQRAGAICATGRRQSTSTWSMALCGIDGATASDGSCTSTLPPQALMACRPAVPSSR